MCLEVRGTKPRSTDRRSGGAPSEVIDSVRRSSPCDDARSSRRGAQHQGFVRFASVVSAVLRSSAVRRPRRYSYTGTGGRARRRLRARSKAPAQGHSSGARSVGRPERLTSRPGTDKNRVRTVRATVSCSSGVMSPSMALQRMRSCASTAHTSHAALAKKCPEGTCSRPAPSFRSRIASSTVACAR